MVSYTELENDEGQKLRLCFGLKGFFRGEMLLDGGRDRLTLLGGGWHRLTLLGGGWDRLTLLGGGWGRLRERESESEHTINGLDRFGGRVL